VAQYFQDYPHLKLYKILVKSVVKYVVREIVWVVRPYSLVGGCEHFRVTHSLTFFLSVEAARSSKSLVITYQTIKHNYLKQHILIKNFFIEYFNPTQNTCTYIQLYKKEILKYWYHSYYDLKRLLYAEERRTNRGIWTHTWLRISIVWSYLITSLVSEDHISSIESNWQQSY